MKRTRQAISSSGTSSSSSSSSTNSETSSISSTPSHSPSRFSIGLQSDVDGDRVRVLKGTEALKPTGPVIYWMSRDQRAEDNWALLHAQGIALRLQVPVVVAFNLVPKFLEATHRQFGFMLRGLREAADQLESELKIPFFLLRGQPEETIPLLAERLNSPLLVCDFSPVRISILWKEKVVEKLKNCPIAIQEVDAHNVIPAWKISDKQEYSAATIRRKVHKQIDHFLTDFPLIQPHAYPFSKSPTSNTSSTPTAHKKEEVQKTGATKGEEGDNKGEEEEPYFDPLLLSFVSPKDWNPSEVLSSLECDSTVKEVKWLSPCPAAAHKALTKFLDSILPSYATERNDPVKNKLSNLSPYFHFGQLSPQRAAYEANLRLGGAGDGKKVSTSVKEGVESFVEELVVRRELAENLCYYAKDRKYDGVEIFPKWAIETLEAHSKDVRTHTYTYEQLEKAETHDTLWNACQLEMTKLGKMHGYMRMYWAKKVLEWTKEGYQEALRRCIQLNDRYELDGRDPNGWAGCAWAIGGVHDRPWPERPIFGKIRYMNAAGCQRKFDVPRYCASVTLRIQQETNQSKLNFKPLTFTSTSTSTSTSSTTMSSSSSKILKTAKRRKVKD